MKEGKKQTSTSIGDPLGRAIIRLSLRRQSVVVRIRGKRCKKAAAAEAVGRVDDVDAGDQVVEYVSRKEATEREVRGNAVNASGPKDARPSPEIVLRFKNGA
eukprot:3358408-Pyramimonas_sp.AAC.1